MDLNKFFRISFLSMIILVLLSACSFKGNLSIDWESDLVYAKKEMLAKEIALRNSQSRSEEFSKKIDGIINRLNRFHNDDEVKVELSKALASIGQLHTKLELGIENVLPFILYMYQDKLYILDTLPQYSNYLFAELVEINGHSVVKMTEQLKSIVSIDNEQGLLVEVPSNIVKYSILHGLGIIKSEGKEVSVSVRLDDGKINTINTPLVYQGDSSLKLISPNKEKFLYSKYGQRNYEYTYLSDVNTVYIAYNNCEIDPEYSMEKFTNDVIATINERKARKVIIDLRNNRGGNSEVIQPLLNALIESSTMKDHIMAITGRYTASSAMANAIQLRSNYDAVLVGEPVNGDPNKPGDILTFSLPNSGLTVYYSTKVFHMQNKNDTSLSPNIYIEPSIKDFKEGNDPVLKEALKYDFNNKK